MCIRDRGNILSVTDGQGNDVSGNPGHIANVNPLRYRGYYFDQETGFYYLHTRYYDPKVGRFINADGLLNNTHILGYNMFAYCCNNPVMMSDPNGDRSIWDILDEQARIANSIIAAVSYTHLDVYKRQGLEDYWSYHSQDVGVKGAAYINDYTGNLVITEDLFSCLLYTSRCV